MRRRAGSHGGGGAHDGAGMGRWLLTYADMITLLLVFFIVLYAVSQVNKFKYETLLRALHQVLTGARALPAIGGSPKAVTAAESQELVKLAKEIQKAVDTSNAQTDVNVTAQQQDVRITLYNGVLFQEGEATIQSSGFPLLDKIAGILAGVHNRIVVQGYTDSLPIHNSRFRSNWDLAAIRATTVLTYLIARGVAADRFEAEAFGQYRPIASNATAEGRRMNRRVDIVVLRQTTAVNVPAPASGSGTPASGSGLRPHQVPIPGEGF